MKQCKALFKKEWDTHKTAFLIPLWVTGGVYVTVLLGWLIKLIKGDGMAAIVTMQEAAAGSHDLIFYQIGASVTVMLGIVAIITSVSLAESLINGGFKRRCEILHFSQPVSFVKIAGVKFLMISLATILLFGLLSFVNAALASLIGQKFLAGDFQSGLMGWLQSFIAVSFTILFAGSLAWFFAGLFKRKSLLMGLLVILGIQVIISILNYIVGWTIPSLTEYLAKLISLEVSLESNMPMQQIPSIKGIVASGWNSIFSWTSAVKIGLSAVFAVAGAWLYQRRELS